MSIDIGQAIASAIHIETKRIVDEEAKLAAERVESRIRGLTGEIAAKVLNHYDIRRMGDNLVITVDFKNTSQ